MSIDAILTDLETSKSATISERDNSNRLHVLTEPLKNLVSKSVFFTNISGSSNLNVNTSVITSTENVHNGNDNTYWTATTISGNPTDFDFSSTDQAHTGTQSISCASAEGGDEFQLANDTLISQNNYDVFIGWIYIDEFWNLPGDGLEIILYNTNTGTQVSENSVDLDNYVDGTLEDVWQQFSIPLSDFGILSDDYDAIRFTMLAGGDPPNFYLDDLQLQKLSSNEVIYNVSPPQGVWWHVRGFGIGIVAPYNSTLVDATMLNIPYNNLLGVELTGGLIYQRIEKGITQFSFNILGLMDILNQFETDIRSMGYDGVSTWLTINARFDLPFTLRFELEDELRFIVNDDLSGLNYFRIVADISEEER